MSRRSGEAPAKKGERPAEDRLRLVVDSIPAMVHTALPDGSLDFFNRTWLDYVGLPLEELLGWGWTKSVHPSDVDGLVAAWRDSIATGNPLDYEARVRRADGEYRWMLHRKVALKDSSGRVVRWFGSSVDVEPLKQAEDRVRASERELRLVIDMVPVNLWTSTPDGEVDFCNRRWLDYTGLSQEDSHRWRETGVTHPDDLQQSIELLETAIKTRSAVEMDVRSRRRDGQYRWFRGGMAPLLDEEGNVIRWYGSLLDIEDRKRAEEAVREREQELRQLIDAVPAQILVLASDVGARTANRAVLEYAGLTPEDFGGSLEDVLRRLVHPEDVDIVRSRHGDSIARGLPFEGEIRLLRKDGTARWFQARGVPSKDETGRLVRWYVIATDIEDRKAREERVVEENIALRDEIDSASMFEEIVGTSAALQRVLSRISKVAPTDSTVLLSGETGTGKELIARAIHKRSKRSSRSFIAVNCAAVPPSLIASELFGHERGAFTGALSRRLGRFELAGGGTIFLDEIGELPAEMQNLLLRVLQEREFERVGGSTPIRANVRVIAATNRNLPASVAAGTFRSDLFYRLNVFPIGLPPLRDRREDIPLLVEYFIERFTRKTGRKFRSIRRATLDLFREYAWPGNVRELQNIIERSMIVCEGDEFAVDESWLTRSASSEVKAVAPGGPAEGGRAQIEAALAATEGRISGPRGAAARLGLPASTLESRIRSLHIDKYRFKRA
ncbi:MAG TPA: sigma 54-interacting transcriptional regulator [Thermoanaerobaculia bacterium]|nr:sigma 54-interacting transcriptional regulator [Thermoanaerobaculia bacterium]